MKIKMLLFSIPFVLLAVFLSHGFLPFLLLPFIILIVNYLVDRKESNPVVQEMKGRLFHSVKVQKYQNPFYEKVLKYVNLQNSVTRIGNKSFTFEQEAFD